MRINLYNEDSLRIWLRCVDGGEDVYLEQIEDRTVQDIGEVPEWFREELSQGGLDGMIDHRHLTIESGVGWVFAQTWTQWMLENGLVPGQPFRVGIDKPHYYKCSYEYDEWDCEWNSWIDAIEPWPAKRSLKALTNLQRRADAYRGSARRAMEELVEKRKTDIDAMFLSRQWYWSSHAHTDSYPDGILVKLCTKHTDVKGFGKFSWGDMVQGRDDDGKYEVALANLIENAKKIVPHISEEQIRKMPSRY